MNNAAAFTHVPCGFLCRDEQAAHIDGEQFLKILQRELLNRRDLALSLQMFEPAYRVRTCANAVLVGASWRAFSAASTPVP